MGSATTANLASLLATYIVEVTAGHYHYGTQLMSATYDPCFCPFNYILPSSGLVGDSYNCGAPGTTIYAYVLMSGTQFENPKITDDFTHLFHGMATPEQGATEIWTQFKSDLTILNTQLNLENSERSVPLYSIVPDLVEISTAV